MHRRELLSLLPAVMVSGLCVSAAQAGDEHLGASLTARAVSLEIPRASLGEVIRVLSESAQVALSVVPALADLQLTGYVPQRPLREIMGALETLFDATWVALPGAAGGFRLEPDPARAKVIVAARDTLFKKQRKEWDEGAADVARKIQTGMLNPSGRTQQVQAFASLLWHLAPPAERDRVMSGAAATFQIPEAQARPVYELIVAISSKPAQPLAGPLVATIDLEDRADTGFPLVRTRATARRKSSILSIITASLEFPSQPVKKDPVVSPGFEGEFEFGPGVGESGRVNGTRDEILVQIAKTANAPLLSRQRAFGATAGIGAGGRKLSQVIQDLALVADGSATSTPRGFHLIRSRTETLDQLGLVPQDRIQAFMKKLPPAKKTVPLEVLMDLASLTCLQLSILHRSNVALEPIGFVREVYAVIRFLNALSPEHRTALFSERGLDAGSLTHLQLHLLLDQRDKRGDFDIYEHLQEIDGLRFRFVRETGEDGDALGLQLYRGDMLVSSQTIGLPAYEPEARPLARR